MRTALKALRYLPSRTRTRTPKRTTPSQPGEPRPCMCAELPNVMTPRPIKKRLMQCGNKSTKKGGEF